MKLSVTDLLSIHEKPKDTEVTLQTIQLFYKEHLCNRVFIFELDDASVPVIKLRFEEDNMCHLLGIHHVLRSIRGGTNYSGQSGYNLIENGTVTFDFMKITNKAGYKSKKNRMLFFPFVYQIVHNPTIIEFSAEGLNTNIDLDIIMYNKMEKTYIHLGLGKDNTSDHYYPKSFYDRKRDDHIEGRKQFVLKSIQVHED